MEYFSEMPCQPDILGPAGRNPIEFVSESKKGSRLRGIVGGVLDVASSVTRGQHPRQKKENEDPALFIHSENSLSFCIRSNLKPSYCDLLCLILIAVGR